MSEMWLVRRFLFQKRAATGTVPVDAPGLFDDYANHLSKNLRTLTDSPNQFEQFTGIRILLAAPLGHADTPNTVNARKRIGREHLWNHRSGLISLPCI